MRLSNGLDTEPKTINKVAGQLVRSARFAVAQVAAAMRSPGQCDSWVRIDAAQLESRVLMSASPLAMDVLDLADGDDAGFVFPNTLGELSVLPESTVGFPAFLEVESKEHVTSPADLEPADVGQASFEEPTLELVFIDQAVNDRQMLVSDLVLVGRDDSDRQIQVAVIDNARDGIEQISEVLQRYDEVDAVHLVSHGTSSQVKLGNTWLNNNNLDAYATQIRSWNSSLKMGADLLFYGCDLASTQDGKHLADQMSDLCDCDVAASIDDTGHADYGGDWNLEYQSGTIEAALAFRAELRQEWSHLMALPTVWDNFDDGAGGSSGYSGNDGSQNWDGGWIESNDTKNRIKVVDRTGGGDWRLLLQGDSDAQDYWVSRQADLSGSTTATFTYDYELVNHWDAGFEVDIRDGDTSWTNVVSYSAIGSRSGAESIAIAANLRDNGFTEIRFRSVYYTDPDFWYIDDVQIEHDGAGGGETYYLDGVGDQSDVPTAILKNTAPIDPTLDNFDPGRDIDLGLLVAKGGMDFDESNPTKQQTWIVSADGVVLDGPATLTLWSAVKNFDALKAGSITAYLVDSDASASSLTEIASVTIIRADWDTADSGSWIEDTFNFGSVNYTLGAGRYLGVKIIVDGASGDDMWIAYDATDHPARVSYFETLNSPPTDIAPNSFAANENVDTTGGFSIGMLSTSDPDIGETFTYSIQPGGDSGLFSIGGVGSDELILDDGVLDFETSSSYSVNLRVTDSAFNTYDETITINVNDLNELPTDTTLDNTTLAENDVAAIIGNVAVIDPDAGDTHTWSVDDSRFEVVAGQLKLKSGKSLDYESESTVNVTITAIDQGGTGLAYNEVFSLTVTDANDVAPVVTPGQSFMVNESAANGTTVGTVMATDVDTIGSIGDWAIAAGNVDGIFAINATTGDITVVDNTNLDFESTNNYTLKITAGDGVNTSSQENVDINIVDFDEPPTITSIADQAVLEAGDTGALSFTVGDPETSASLLTVTATSSNQTVIPDANLIFSGSGAARDITAVPAVGQIGGPATITVTVDDGTNATQEMFDVTVVPRIITVTTMADENDGNTTDLLTLMNTPGGSGISLREAIIATNNTLLGGTPDQIVLPSGHYTLNRGSGDDSANSGDLDIKHDVLIDGGGAQTTIIDGNSLDNVFDILNSSTASLSDLTILGATSSRGAIYVDGSATLNLTDVTVRDNVGTATGGAGHIHGTLNLDRVTLSNNTADSGGALYFHGADGASLTNVTISGNMAASGEGGGIWTDTVITVTNSTIVNNTGTTVGGVFVSGSGDTILTNSILDNNGLNANGLLTSNGYNIDTDGSALLLGPSDQSGTLVTPLNVMLGPLQDNGGSTFTHQLLAGSIAIDQGTSVGAPAIDQRGTIRDAFVDIGAFEFVGSGNPPTAITPNSFAINENTDTSGGVSLGILTATDPDLVDSFTYEIWAGTDQAKFSIGGAGSDELILTDGTLDFESQSSYSVVVRVRDSGNNTYFEPITVSVKDLNDAPTAITPNSFNVNENIDTSGGYSVGLLSTIDEDSVDMFTYAVQGGADQTNFSIGGTSGDELMLSDGTLDHESKSGYSVIVRVTDSGGQTHDETIIVSVNDLNESPTAIAPTNFSVDENIDTTGGYSLGMLSTTDQDSPDSFTYSIQGGLDAAKFSVGGVGGDELILSDANLDHESQSSYIVSVRVVDSGGNTHDETIIVNVNDLNDPPSVSLANITASLAENTDTSSSIKVADILVADDALGTNTLVLAGSDSGQFVIVGGTELHLKAGASLDFETRSLLNVTVAVDDTAVGGTPDDTASLALAITDVNESPVASDDAYVSLSTTLLVAAPGVLVNDADPEGDPLSVTMMTSTTHGTLMLRGDGSFTYIPDSGFFGPDAFTYRVDDGVTASNVAMVNILVQLPVAPPSPPTEEPGRNDEGDPNTDDSPEPEITADDIGSPRAPTGPVRRSTGVSSIDGDDVSSFVVAVGLDFPVIETLTETLPPILSRTEFFRRDPFTATSSRTVATSFLTDGLTSAFIGVLDELRDEVDNDDLLNKVIVGSSVAVSTSLSVGYVIWLIRGGVLLSSVLSSMPAWRMVDPLPVLGYLDDEEKDANDDSLESLVAKSNSGRKDMVQP